MHDYAGSLRPSRGRRGYRIPDHFRYLVPLGLPADECAAYALESEAAVRFRSRLFTRIVPMMKDIGLWGPKIRKAYAEMGVLDFAQADLGEMTAADEAVAERFDADLRERMSEIESVSSTT